jgi:hypothetical protein
MVQLYKKIRAPGPNQLCQYSSENCERATRRAEKPASKPRAPLTWPCNDHSQLLCDQHLVNAATTMLSRWRERVFVRELWESDSPCWKASFQAKGIPNHNQVHRILSLHPLSQFSDEYWHSWLGPGALIFLYYQWYGQAVLYWLFLPFC